MLRLSSPDKHLCQNAQRVRRIAHVYRVIHNFLRVHFTTKEVPNAGQLFQTSECNGHVEVYNIVAWRLWVILSVGNLKRKAKSRKDTVSYKRKRILVRETKKAALLGEERLFS